MATDKSKQSDIEKELTAEEEKREQYQKDAEIAEKAIGDMQSIGRVEDKSERSRSIVFRTEEVTSIDILEEDLLAAGNRLTQALLSLIECGEFEPLSESVSLLAEVIDWAKQVSSEQIATMDEVVRDFVLNKKVESCMPRLLDMADATFEYKIRPLLGEIVEIEVFLWAGEVLLGRRKANEIPVCSSIFSEVRRKMPIDGFDENVAGVMWELHQQRAVRLMKELFVDFQPWPRPPDPPDVPEDPTYEDVLRLVKEYYCASRDSAKAIGVIASGLAEAKLILSYFSVRENPLFIFTELEISEHRELIGKLEQNADLGGQMLVLWLEHLSHTLNISLELNRITEAVKAENPN